MKRAYTYSDASVFKVREALKSLPATSVDAERAFSIAAGFATKRRARISPKFLLTLMFARRYFDKVDREAMAESST